MSNLTLPGRKKPLESAEDFIKSDQHNLVFLKGSAAEEFLTTADSGLMRDVWTKTLKQNYYVLDPSFDYADQLITNPDHVFFADASAMADKLKYELSTVTGNDREFYNI